MADHPERISHPWGARRRPPLLVVVDPLRTEAAEQAEIHLPVKPGTNVMRTVSQTADVQDGGPRGGHGGGP